MNWKTFDFKSKKSGRKGEILNKSIYKCGFCGGRKFIPSKRDIKCPACMGIGVIRIKPPAVICAYCNGSGKSLLNSALTCSVCGGKGVVSINIKKVELCHACKGRGREKGMMFPCSKCGGRGVVKNAKVTNK